MKRTLVVTTVTALVLGLALTALAQRKKARPEEPKMKAELKLSDEQREKLAAIHRQSAKERIRLNAERQVAHLELQELLQSDRPDQGAIDGKIDQLADLEKQLAANRLQCRVAARSVLTKEQWAALKGKMGKRMMLRGPHRNMRFFRFRGPGGGFGPGMGPGRPMGDESFEEEETMPEEADAMDKSAPFGFVDEPGFNADFFPFETERELDLNIQPPASPDEEGWQ